MWVFDFLSCWTSHSDQCLACESLEIFMNDRWMFVKLKPQKNGFWASDEDRTRGDRTRNLLMIRFGPRLGLKNRFSGVGLDELQRSFTNLSLLGIILAATSRTSKEGMIIALEVLKLNLCRRQFTYRSSFALWNISGLTNGVKVNSKIWVVLCGIRTHIFGLPVRCSISWATELSGNCMLVESKCTRDSQDTLTFIHRECFGCVSESSKVTLSRRINSRISREWIKGHMKLQLSLKEILLMMIFKNNKD